MNRWKVALLLGGIVLIAAAFVGCSSGGTKPDEQAATPATGTPGSPSSARVGTAVGDTAPDFRLTGLDGSEVKLADLRGRPAVLIFWTAWCPVCKEEAPHFNELAAQYEPRGVSVLGINIQDSVARTEGGIRDFGIRYAVARDPDASVTRRYNVTGTPTIILLDSNGLVQYFGNEVPADFNSRLNGLLTNGG
ncbi:MAG: TlpA family protein disulfide reductase [Acidobacteria bacterium]|nr:TlpA family protein disulfide reductase [Acidobacteriota bacterium]